MKPRELAGRVAQGYARLFRSLAEAALILAGLAGIALGVSYPIWWLAVNNRGLYSWLVAGIVLLAAVFIGIRRLTTATEDTRTRTIGSYIVRLLVFCMATAGAYGSAVLLSRSLALGCLAFAVLFVLLGIWTFGYGGSTGRGR